MTNWHIINNVRRDIIPIDTERREMKLKEIRKEKGITQQKLAEFSGVSQSQIARYESGERQPRPKVAQRLAKVLDFDWKEIYEEEEDDEGRI